MQLKMYRKLWGINACGDRHCGGNSPLRTGLVSIRSRKQEALSRDIFLMKDGTATEACIDLAMHIVAEKSLGIPQKQQRWI